MAEESLFFALIVKSGFRKKSAGFLHGIGSSCKKTAKIQQEFLNDSPIQNPPQPQLPVGVFFCIAAAGCR
ncbi:hypothetical protein [Rheinheimera sp.]|uniref:hypothetical protein n=1 Tax=Rheinheimera sp. TaxID=1869214 RepID=UPI00307E3F86